MKRYKRITKELIRAYFGPSAKISGFGHYRVKTPTGGEVVISQKTIRIVFGGDDTYRAVTLLIGECWGGAIAKNGSREFMLGAMLHGEAEGVSIQPDYSDKGASFAQIFVFICIIVVSAGLGMAQTETGAIIMVLLACGVPMLMHGNSKKEQQRKAEEMGFHYPRVHGQPRGASREDAARKGWL